MPSASNHLPSEIERLTPRERECLRLVAQHLSSKQIARELAVSQHTVDGHLNEARRKLGAATRRDAARMLLEAEDGSPLMGLGGKFNGGRAEDAAPSDPHPPSMFPPTPLNEGGQSRAVAVSAAPLSAPASLDVVEDFHAPAFPAAAPAQTPSYEPAPQREPPVASGLPPASAPIQKTPRYELTPPQRLLAVVVIATASALLLLLLLFGVQELTRLFEQLTEAG